MAREMMVIMSNTERNRKWRAENPEKVFLAQTRRNIKLKKKRDSDLQFNLIQREKDRKKKQKYRLAIKARVKTQSGTNQEVDPLASKEMWIVTTLKIWQAAMVAFSLPWLHWQLSRWLFGILSLVISA